MMSTFGKVVPPPRVAQSFKGRVSTVKRLPGFHYRASQLELHCMKHGGFHGGHVAPHRFGQSSTTQATSLRRCCEPRGAGACRRLGISHRARAHVEVHRGGGGALMVEGPGPQQHLLPLRTLPLAQPVELELGGEHP